MTFRLIFVAICVGTALVLAAYIVNLQRPEAERTLPSAELVRATGKCAECHRMETAAVVHQFEMSSHSANAITCLECHRPVEGQESIDHNGFTITAAMTAKNCAQCHKTEYEQFARSRHGAPAWAAVTGAEDFTPEQIAAAEEFHPGAVDRPANVLARMQGEHSFELGCMGCHNIGKPNMDGSIGTCTNCHGDHTTSIALARNPQTCGQCHMGPDHSQIEIYNESKHGVIFHSQRDLMNLDADPKTLSVDDMSVPTCATCHMSGLEGMNVTHDTTERLSYWLFDAVSDKRPTYAQGKTAMQELCMKCHASTHVERIYTEAEKVVDAVNARVISVEDIMNGLREDNLITPEPFDEPIEFVAFDYWHYFGRTAKHGAYMGGADFVQWHGNYELLAKLVEIEEMAEEIRHERGILDGDD